MFIINHSLVFEEQNNGVFGVLYEYKALDFDIKFCNTKFELIDCLFSKFGFETQRDVIEKKY
jgi:hypothetical protein